jgi:hypothetical protein
MHHIGPNLIQYRADRKETAIAAVQELNALPFAAMTINCASWVFYALLLTDYYIYFGNLPGMLFGMYYVLTCYKFSKEAVSCIIHVISMMSATAADI